MSQHKLLLRPTPASSIAKPITPKKKRRCGEVMGGATAECTAVVCCCPFAVMDILVLALYKAPKGMCRKAIKKKNRKNKLLRKQREGYDDEVIKRIEKVELDDIAIEREAIEAADLEMYEKLYGTGFWRSDSQRSSSTL